MRRVSYREGALIFIAAAAVVAGLLTLVAGWHHGSLVVVERTSTVARSAPAAAAEAQRAAARHAGRQGQPSVRLVAIVGSAARVIHVVDPTRTIAATDGSVMARSFDVLVRYPVTRVLGPGEHLSTTVRTIHPMQTFPLVVFGHGYAVTPEPYADLLTAWADAGYVVAAPIFPLENANAPGGPNERDLPNQPRDMTATISWLLTHPATVPVRLNAREIAVAGQSDGGDTALATAYDPRISDRRVAAAIILSGAEDPFVSAFTMPATGPPLLAVQGTADTINPPGDTASFFAHASPPKYLLHLVGAGHQPPYTQPGEPLREVERITIAFLDYYFRHFSRSLSHYVRIGSVGPHSELISMP